MKVEENLVLKSTIIPYTLQKKRLLTFQAIIEGSKALIEYDVLGQNVKRESVRLKVTLGRNSKGIARTS